MKKQSPLILSFCCLLYSLWESRALASSWVDTPYLHGGWVAFLLWILPVIAYWLLQAPKKITPIFFGIGLACTLGGVLGALNVLKHIGLAFTIFGFLPRSWGFVPWFFTALTWIPATAYFVREWPLSWIPGIRIILAIAGMLAGIYWVYQYPQEEESP